MAQQQGKACERGTAAGTTAKEQSRVRAWSPSEKPQQGAQQAQELTPETLKQQKAQTTPAQPKMDCLGCRMVGLAFGLGGGGYIMSQLITASPAPKGAHRAGILAAAGAMFCMGMYRALWP
jgi:hypothetical protein